MSNEEINLFLESSLNNCEKMIFSGIGLFRISYTKGWMRDERKRRCRLLGNVNFLALLGNGKVIMLVRVNQELMPKNLT